MIYKIISTGQIGELFSARRGSVTLKIKTPEGWVLRDYPTTQVVRLK